MYKNISELKDEIIRNNNEIEIFQNLIENFNKRVDICRAAKEGHLAYIIFHACENCYVNYRFKVLENE